MWSPSIVYTTRMTLPYIHSTEALETYLQERGLTWEKAHLPAKSTIQENFSIRFPRFYANLINWQDADDPLRKLVLPDQNELEVHPYELSDPIGDHTHEPVPGLIHRYPNRCLLLLTTHCIVHCRFCFRRDVIGKPLPTDIVGIEKYLREHTEIHEVIFSGGDPATLPAAFLKHFTEKLGPLAHIDTWRFHTRTLVVDPLYVQDDWIEEIAHLENKQKIIVLHVDHPREVTPELKALVEKLRQKQISVLSQTVLLKGVNDSVETLTNLFTALSAIGVKPYYLHHLDKARGTNHFRVSIEEGQELYKQLRGKISGYSIPEYVLDLPGGDGKVPVMWLRKINQADSGSVYEIENFSGKLISYQDPQGK
jgi:lysine 2,3-aminomutase